MRIGKHRRAALFVPLTSAFILPTGLSAASEPQAPVLGELPEGAISAYEVRDVRTELCRNHVFRPGTMAVNMPDGFRLATLADKPAVPAVAKLLQQQPELRAHARGSFCFIEAGVHLVNGKPVHPGRPSRVAFLWADMVPTGPVSSDPRYRGDMRRVQLFFLYDADGVNKELARQATPNALFGRITMEKAGDVWRVGLHTDDGALTGEMRSTSPRRRLEHPQPGYETVALSDAAREYFHIVTYAGHHEQDAAGEWRASGQAPWARSFEGAAPDTGFFIQDGFAARLGLYRYSHP